MKPHDLLFCLVFFRLFLFPTDSEAQWQADARLTADSAISYTSYNTARCIAANGNDVHVVWYDYRDGNGEIYYKHSADGGTGWEADTRLTNDGALSELPSVAVSGSLVHVVWMDDRNGNSEIYYKRSTDMGTAWGTDIRLSNDPSLSELPSVSVSDSVVHVVWSDDRDGNKEIYDKRSTDGGTSWEADTRLTNNSAQSTYPSVTTSGSGVHVVWYDNRDGNDEIYYTRSTDGGMSWGAETRLTSNSALSWVPSVSASGTDVHVVWTDERDGNAETYYKRSTDGGILWGPDTRLTNNPAASWNPSVAASGSVLHVVWWDDRDGNQEIYYTRSTDGGTSWEAEARLTNDPALSNRPSVSVSGSLLHVVWRDFRDANWEIYYKRNPTGNPTGVENIGWERPQEFGLSQNYPNPFNPNTRIGFSLPNSALVTMKIYDMLGKEVAILVSQELPPGRYEVPWDAVSLTSGVYLYRLQADRFSQTRKLILIR